MPRRRTAPGFVQESLFDVVVRYERRYYRQILEALTRRLGVNHPAIVALRGRRYLHQVIDPHPF